MVIDNDLPVPTPAQRGKCQRLASAHRIAGREQDRHPSDTADALEQSTWDAWVDYIEEQGLNWTTLDPRGTRAEYEASMYGSAGR